MDDENEQIAHNSSYSRQKPLNFLANLEFASDKLQSVHRAFAASPYVSLYIRRRNWPKTNCVTSASIFGYGLIGLASRNGDLFFFHDDRQDLFTINQLAV